LASGPGGENAGVAYQLRILHGVADADPACLAGEVDAAITADGFWELYAEVRMGAGPMVRISGDSRAGYEVRVSWGSQDGHLRARSARSAVECADWLASAFYEMRDARLVQG
jgi:hypothetical protein